LEPNISSDNKEEDDDVASLRKKGEIVFHAIGKKKIACSNFVEILFVAIESKKIIDELVTTQDFVKFWGNFFAFVLLEMNEISQGFKNF
jgi:hypothetical protein